MLNDKETSVVDAYKEVVGNDEIDSTILKLCSELYSSKYYKTLLEKVYIVIIIFLVWNSSFNA